MSAPARNCAVVTGSQLASTRLTDEAGAVAGTHDKLVSPGTAQVVTDKTRSYRLALGCGRRPWHQRGGPLSAT